MPGISVINQENIKKMARTKTNRGTSSKMEVVKDNKRKNDENVSVNKKQKSDSKKQNISEDDHQNDSLNTVEIMISFPNKSETFNLKDALLNVINQSEEVNGIGNLSLFVKHEKTEEVLKKINEAKMITTNTNISAQKIDPKKRIVPLKPIGADTEKAKNYFDATSIVQILKRGRPLPLYVLEFSSEEDANKADEKSLFMDGRTVTTEPYIIFSQDNQSEPKENKEKVTKNKEQSAEVQAKKKQKKEEGDDEGEEEDDDDDDEDDDEGEEEEDEGEEKDDDDDDDDDDE